MSVGEYIRGSQVWKSIFRHPAPVDRRNRVVVMLTNFFLHLHPVSIKQQGIALSYTWCMGRITFFLFLVETITGVVVGSALMSKFSTSPATSPSGASGRVGCVG